MPTNNETPAGGHLRGAMSDGRGEQPLTDYSLTTHQETTILSLTDAAGQINHHHRLALDHATKAANHAVTIGNLLLEIKEGLPHGAYTPWIEEYLDVSPRQARHYVDAALGKPLTPRQIKSDTVSVLEFLPEPGDLLWADLRGNAESDLYNRAWLAIQESSKYPGYYHLLFIDGAVEHFLKKPIKPEYLDFSLEKILPGEFLTIGVDRFDWQQSPIHQGGIEWIIDSMRCAHD